MAITRRTPPAPTEQTATTNPTNIPLSTGSAAGDVCLMKVVTGNASAAGISGATGWTLIEKHSRNGSTQVPSCAMFIRVLDGSEGANVSLNHGAVAFTAQIVHYVGVDNVTPLDITVTGSGMVVDQVASQSTIDFSCSPVTSGAALSLVASGNSTTQTSTPPTGFNETGDRSVSGARAFHASDILSVAAGATGTLSVTWSGPSGAVGIMVALRPASTGVSGTAGFSGVGTLTTAQVPTVSAPAGFSGSGTVTTTQVPSVPAPAGFGGSGTLSTTQTPSVPAPAGFSGVGTLSTAVVPRAAAPGAFSGAGALTTAQVPRAAATATFGGVGTLTVLGPAAATFAGVGTLTTAQVPRAAATGTFAGVGTLTTAQVPRAAATAGFSGVGSLGTTQIPRAIATGTFAGVGTLTTAQVPRAAATATFGGVGTLTAAGPAVATFAGVGTLSTTQKPSVTTQAGFSGAGSLTAAVVPRPTGAGAFSGSGSIATMVAVTVATPAHFTGNGQLQAFRPASDLTATLLSEPSSLAIDRGHELAARLVPRHSTNRRRLHPGETTWVGPITYRPRSAVLNLAVAPAGATPAAGDWRPPDVVNGRAGLFLALELLGTYGLFGKDAGGTETLFAELIVT